DLLGEAFRAAILGQECADGGIHLVRAGEQLQDEAVEGGVVHRAQLGQQWGEGQWTQERGGVWHGGMIAMDARVPRTAELPVYAASSSSVNPYRSMCVASSALTAGE